MVLFATGSMSLTGLFSLIEHYGSTAWQRYNLLFSWLKRVATTNSSFGLIYYNTGVTVLNQQVASPFIQSLPFSIAFLFD